MTYNSKITSIPMPDRIKALPVSPSGFPIPWFVHSENGIPDFRVIGRGKLETAWKRRLCWTCGQPLGRIGAMLLGPMCCINRTISEPASHRDCAVYSAIACPFLSNPRMRRNEKDLPEDATEAAGIALKRNPGAVAVWCTRGWRPFRAPGGYLFTFDDPVDVLWFANGRRATRAEVDDSINSGLFLLRAEAEKEGHLALAALGRQVRDAQRYLPEHAS